MVWYALYLVNLRVHFVRRLLCRSSAVLSILFDNFSAAGDSIYFAKIIINNVSKTVNYLLYVLYCIVLYFSLKKSYVVNVNLVFTLATINSLQYNDSIWKFVFQYLCTKYI